MHLVPGVYEPGVSPELGPSSRTITSGGDRDRRDVFHVSFDPATESPTQVVTEAAAVIHNEDPEELGPLYEAVDPEALDDPVTPPGDDHSGVEEIQFVYAGLEVVLESEGNAWLRRK